MRTIKITQLPNGPWREYALEAQRRGIELVSDCSLSGTDVILIGACDFIRELNGEINDKYDGIFYYLILNKSITQNYKDALDFERAKLHYIIVKYFDSLFNLQDTLISIVEDFKYYGIVNFDPAEVIDNVTRCNSKLGKFQTAYLFKILFDSKLFYYDQSDSDNNEKLMIQFLNKNFTYTRRDKKLEDIKNVKTYKERDVLYSI